MEWLAIGIWLLVALLALPLGAGALFGRASLALQAMAAIGGLALVIVYVSVGRPSAAVWVACGLGVVGVIAMAFAAAGLTSDHGVGGAGGGGVQGIEEHQAMLAGVQLPMFAVVTLLTMLLALEIGT
jgi:hypothetical protein